MCFHNQGFKTKLARRKSRIRKHLYARDARILNDHASDRATASVYLGTIRKPAAYILENKGADSTIPLLLKSEISSLEPSPVAVQFGLCRTSLEAPKTGLLKTWFIFTFEPRHEKTSILHMRKQRRRSASR